MQMQYLIALPGSLHAGTRTMIFTTGGGGYFGKQSSVSPARNVGDAANGVANTKITAPNAVRASEVAVFMADTDWLRAGLVSPLSRGAIGLSCQKPGNRCWKCFADRYNRYDR